MTKSNRFLPLVVLLFFGSGCAALIYEIVWFQLLQLVIGSSAISMGVLLGTFMGGMCIGSLALPRIISAERHPIRVYALLEIGIGVIGVLVLFGLPYIAAIYGAIGGYGFWGILLRGVVCGICLLPPTILMGATLPAIARWVEATPTGISWLGFFYGGNIAGAVFGCLLAGFYLLRVHDMTTATYVAAVLNMVVALAGFQLARWTTYRVPAEDSDRSRVHYVKDAWPVYLAIGLSGLCALGAEVVWTRLLSLLLGGSVYTFSLILAVFLLGLGIGSSAGAVLARNSEQARRNLGYCQMLLSAAIAWAAYMLTSSIPYWPIDPVMSTSLWFNFQLDVVRCALTVLPAACLWGASFPLALAAVPQGRQDPGRLVGGVYAANTVGAIAGAVGFSLVFVSWLGTQHAQQLLIVLSAVAGLLMLSPAVEASPKKRSGFTDGLKVTVPTLVAILLIFSVSPTPAGLVGYGRFLARVLALRDTRTGASALPKMLYVGEGMNATIAVSEMTDGNRNFHISGKIEASSLPRDMRLERMLGHLPALYHQQPRSVLIVGFGAGVTAGTFVLHPSVERIVICEIEPLVPQVISQYFEKQNYRVFHDPRVEVIYDDARNYIRTTKEKFDLITSDPIHPWVKGAASLYTREYFDLVKQHLNPGGVISQWVPLYESNAEAVKSEVATFFEVFPNGTVWSSDRYRLGYDVVLLAKDGEPEINLDELSRRMSRPDHSRVMESLREVEVGSVVDLLATYSGRAAELKTWLADAEINRDRNLRLQYLAGLGLNLDQNPLIYAGMIAGRRFSEELFVGSDELKQSLREAITNPQSVPAK